MTGKSSLTELFLVLFNSHRYMYYKTAEEIELIRENCMIVSKTLAHVASILRPGITGKEVDRSAESYIRDHGAVPGFLGFGGFPASLCISINDCVVHGIPSDRPFENGDIVSVDCGSFKDGFYGDAAYTFAIGEVGDEVMKLLSVTRDSLYLAIDQAVVGNRIGDIGYAVQSYTEGKHGFGVVRALVGHGLGRELHEPPQVPNFGKRGRGKKLKEGLVIAIEPMINLGTKEVFQEDDGWTIRTKDRKASAHYEHSLAITAEGPMILSNHALLEEEIKNNPNLTEISTKNAIFALRKN